jgi:hypothetical protein
MIPPAAIPRKRAEMTSLVQKQRARVRAAGTMDQRPKSSYPGARAMKSVLVLTQRRITRKMPPRVQRMVRFITGYLF